MQKFTKKISFCYFFSSEKYSKRIKFYSQPQKQIKIVYTFVKRSVEFKIPRWRTQYGVNSMEKFCKIWQIFVTVRKLHQIRLNFCTRGDSVMLITNLNFVFRNSKWRIQFEGQKNIKNLKLAIRRFSGSLIVKVKIIIELRM